MPGYVNKFNKMMGGYHLLITLQALQQNPFSRSAGTPARTRSGLCRGTHTLDYLRPSRLTSERHSTLRWNGVRAADARAPIFTLQFLRSNFGFCLFSPECLIVQLLIGNNLSA